MNIKCSNPIIIRNKVARYKVNYRDWTFVLRGRAVLSVPSPGKAKILESELEDCYYRNDVTGEIVPMYIQVPCGKCLLCAEKKQLDWSCRLFAEANYHDNCPWWITLTYNNYGLPKDKSIHKSELQGFLKRLRERVSRVVSKDVRLRFVGVGEYGSNYHRPHYHLQLFGLPMMSATAVLIQLENAWSTRVSKKVYMSLPPEYRFFRYDKNMKKLYYQRKGYVYVKPAHDNTPAYLAKYMFKPELNTPKGCVPNFNLSSRRHGIGYDWICEFRDFYRRNPNMCRVSITSKWTGKIKNFGFPQYFKDYIFPTLSKILSSEPKKAVDDFRRLYNEFNCCCRQLDKRNIQYYDDVQTMVSDISKKYDFWNPVTPTMIDSEKEFNSMYQLYYKENEIKLDNKILTLYLESYDVFLLDLYKWYYKRMLCCYDYLMSIEFTTEDIVMLTNLREIHKSFVNDYLRNQPDVDIKSESERIMRDWYKRKRKDMN